MCVNVCREFIDFACFGYFQSITQFMGWGYLVDVNVLAFNSPGPVPEGVM